MTNIMGIIPLIPLLYLPIIYLAYFNKMGIAILTIYPLIKETERNESSLVQHIRS